jgi:hypothetical protein
MAPRPPIADALRLAAAARKGSPADRPLPFVAALRDLIRTPEDSPLTLEALMQREDYRDLRTPKLRVGDPAFDFELPSPSGATVRLSDFRGVQPVALIFGSYT